MAKGCIDAVIDCNLRSYNFIQLVSILKRIECEIYDWRENDTCYNKRIMASKLERIRYNGIKILSKVYQYHNWYIFTMIQSPCMDGDNILND
ncbi:MAG: Histidinol-phosphatase [Candidatus Hodgkinia cicadicola]|nr:MAG: Histidinol-phosphatase [Candidatus Hodgkinia cicadicola]